MKWFMKGLEFVLVNFDKIVKFVLKIAGKKQQELEADKKED